MPEIKKQLKEQLPMYIDKNKDKSIDTSWDNFKTILTTLMTNNIPQKTTTSRWNIPWITRKIRRSIRTKQRQYNKAKKTGKEADWAKFRERRKHIKKELEKEHKNYLSNILDIDNIESEAASKQCITERFWRYIKAKKQDNSGVSTLNVGGETMEDSTTKAEALNNQFQSVFTQENMTTFPDMGTSNTSNIGDIQIDEKGITKLLQHLNINKACGPDNISCRILKEAAEEIAPYLKFIFDRSLELQEVPHDWRTANITALYKKGDKSQPVNYRPVSLTSVPCKVMEHILFKHIMEHLEANNILADFQHGFREKRSCETQLIITVEEISRYLDNRQQVDLLILDFSKAFDTVPHHRLLQKLDHYGVRGNIHGWLKSWLTSRDQRVVVDGDHSTSVPVRSGVPQGTVLGPLMFLLYINDIGDDIKSSIRLFADDSLIYMAISSRDHCQQLQDDLTTVVNWTKKWQMIFNPSKCYVLQIARVRALISYPYHMDGHVLETVSHNPYLGVELTNTLSWDTHIQKIIGKANRSLGFLRRNLGKCPTNIKRQVYLGLVRPHLEYASSVWDPHLQKHIYQLEMVQRREARFIRHEYSREPGTVTSLLEELDLATLQERRKTARLLLFHKVIHQKVAIPLPDYLLQPTRRTRQYHQRRFVRLGSHGEQRKNRFFVRTIKDWNDLPPDILDLDNYEAFKTGLIETRKP